MNIISSVQSTGSTAALAPVARKLPADSVAADVVALPAANVPAQAVQGKKAGAPTAAELQQAVDQANTVLKAKTSNELLFSVDKSTGLSVVKMINQQTGETLLQFPSEAMLQIAKSIDQMTGAIVRRQA